MWNKENNEERTCVTKFHESNNFIYSLEEYIPVIKDLFIINQLCDIKQVIYHSVVQFLISKIDRISKSILSKLPQS